VFSIFKGSVLFSWQKKNVIPKAQGEGMSMEAKPGQRNQSGNGWRFINRDGTINVRGEDFRRSSLFDLYHMLLSMRWRMVFLLVTIVYLLVNIAFGTAFYLGGPDALHGIQSTSPSERWLECFFFSVQTLATIGYGGISPNTHFAHFLVTIEALTGLIGLTLITGMIFSRFSRPTARIRFSEHALITRLDGQPCLIFRMANARLNQITQAQVYVSLARSETTKEGLRYREFYDLKLERERSLLFAMTWTVVHPICEGSPLYGQTKESLLASDTEIITTFTGTDETYLQMVHARFSYAPFDIEWNTDFQDMVSRDSNGYFTVRLEKIDATRPSLGEPVSEPIR
jgi:inward rectifier potassium channel